MTDHDETLPMNYDDVFDLLGRVSATLHICDGRVSGSLHIHRPRWVHVKFRGGKDEPIADTLRRAIKELHRRQIEGMPRTTQTAPCAACGHVSELRFLNGAKQWLCEECRRGLRQMSDERRRAARRKQQKDGGLTVD